MGELTDADMKSLGQGLPPNLTSLQLSFECTGVTDAGALNLITRIPLQLRSLRLDFSGCEKVADAALQALAEKVPQNIKSMELYFNNCPQVSRMGLAALAGALPRELKHCKISL